jgi:ABC-2 type transport system permease protein
MFLQMLGSWLAGRVYLKSYSRLQTERGQRRRTAVHWIDTLLLRMLPMVPVAIRLLLVKDFRIVRRDPLQWAQFLIFFGLVGLYFLNIKSVHDAAPFAGWVNMVSFLNMLVVGLILSTFTTRFIFPMISLEGQRFWILGLLPIDRDTILWGKFLLASIGTWIPSSLLILLSDVLLKIPAGVIAIHELTCVLLCLGLAAIAVGLGACMPDLRATSPSKIAAGFGGTLNLVLSALYIITVVGLTAVPCHLHKLVQMGHFSGILNIDTTRNLMVIGTTSAVLIGAIVVTVLLWIGFRAFRRMEF